VNFFELPKTLDADITRFADAVRAYAQGEMTPEVFRPVRAGFGIYEQRTKGTFMVRIRCTGGGITPGQLRAIARIAAGHGDAPLHLTTRQELQIHRVPLDRLVETVRAVHAADLATRGGGGDGVRNIVVPWDAGITPEEEFDVMPYAVALMNWLGASEDSWRLPRKLKMAFAGSARGMAEVRCTDLGFVARRGKDGPGFAVYVAGGMGRTAQVARLLHEFVPAREVYVVAEAVKRVFAAHGNRTDRSKARLRFLWNELGRERFIGLYTAQRGELMARSGWELEPVPLPGKAGAGPASGGCLPASQEFETWARRFVSPQRQPGMHSVVLPVSRGVLDIGTAQDLAAFLEPFGDDVVRCTAEQNLALRNIPASALPQVHAMAVRLFPLSNHPRVIGTSIACTGAATCALGLCRAPDALGAIEERLCALGTELDACPDLRLALSGCGNACGRHLMADLGFSGMVGRHNGAPYPAYGVFTGARFTNGDAQFAAKAGEIAAQDLAGFAADVVLGFARTGACTGFAAYADGPGRVRIKTACASRAQVPTADQNPAFYVDGTAGIPFLSQRSGHER